MTKQGFCLFVSAILLFALTSQLMGDSLSPEDKKEFEEKIISNEASVRAQAVSILSKADDAKAFKMLLKILERERDDTVLEAVFSVMKDFTDKKGRIQPGRCACR
jgi:divalent metal cation (Fe/Co/Zn/Cd) transporter